VDQILLPKTDRNFSTISDEELKDVEIEFKQYRPRKRLKFKTPQEVLLRTLRQTLKVAFVPRIQRASY